jgi:dihydropteroate synthase
MGVVNVTPNSFYDGGRYLEPDAACRRVDELIEEGASLVDIGGESSRPGAGPVAPEEQVARIRDVVRHALDRKAALVSVDTTSALVADRMLALGAHIINDVSCLADPELAGVVARYRATLILMHSRGRMDTMPGFSEYPERAYGDVVNDVLGEWRQARERAVLAGVDRESIWLDPGLGFHKSANHSWELLRRLTELRSERVPVVIGPSRKSFIASVDRSPPEGRMGGTIAACLIAVERGASVLRVHDVREVRQALAVARVASRSADAAGVTDHV